MVRVAGVVYSDSGGRRQITEIAEYANNVTQCRQSTISLWGQQDRSSRCDKQQAQCDICAKSHGPSIHDIRHIVGVVLDVIRAGATLDTQLTYLNVVDGSFGKLKTKALKEAISNVKWPLTKESLQDHVLDKFVNSLLQ